MSRFMENLLSRHREGSAETGTVALVQPRPKARFESDLGLTAVTVPGNGSVPLGDFEQEPLLSLSDNHLETTSLFRPVPVIAPVMAGNHEWLHQDVDKPIRQNNLFHSGEQTSEHTAPVQSSPAAPEQENEVQEPAGRGKTRQSGFQLERSVSPEQASIPSLFSTPDELKQDTDEWTRKTGILQSGILSGLNVQAHTGQATLPLEPQPLDPKTDLIIGASSSQSPVQQEVSPVTQPAIEQQSLSDEFRQQLRTIQQRLNAQQPQEAAPAISSAEQIVSDREVGILKNTDRQLEGIPFQTGKQSNRAESVASEPDRRIQEVRRRLNAPLQKNNGPQSSLQSEQKIRNREGLFAARETTRPIPSAAFERVTGEEKHGQQLSTHALKRELQPVLHRLTEKQRKEGREEQARPGNPSVSGNETSMPTTRRNVPPESLTNREKPRIKSERGQQPEGRSAPSESTQTGLLQPPAWLVAAQAELQHRRQQSTPQSRSEPVINVSIGRVEVRAVQSKSATKPKNRQKPSGIMSLDDYLKQRENRGRI